MLKITIKLFLIFGTTLLIIANPPVINNAWVSNGYESTPNGDATPNFDSGQSYDSNFRFEKVIYSSGRCMGPCRAMKIEINSSGLVFFYGQYNTDPYKGYYKGMLSKKRMEELIALLKRNNIDRIPEDMGSMLDAQHIRARFIYNGKTRNVAGSNIPAINRELFDFLSTIYQKTKLEKMNGEYLFDGL